MSSSFNNSRNSPKYAVVHLPEGTNVINFYQLLLSNGFSEVSFVNEIRENAFLPSIMGGSCLSSNENKNDLTNKNIISTNNETINPTIEKVVDSVAKISNNTTLISSIPQKSLITINNGQKTLKDIALIKMFGENQQNILLKNIQIKKNNILPNISLNGGGSNNNNSDDYYSVCLLCKSRLLSTRLSNLVNHVRRHATSKQFSCRNCNYEHIEMGKVRLHMLKSHKDTNPPLDRLNFEMQIEWGMLMEKCFPEHAKRFGLATTVNSSRSFENLQKFVDLNINYICNVCGELIVGNQLINHIEDIHHSECIDYICGECGYENELENNIYLHINSQHKEKANNIIVEQRETKRNCVHFVKNFFTNVNQEDLNNSKNLLESHNNEKEKEVKNNELNLSEDEELKLELEENSDFEEEEKEINNLNNNEELCCSTSINEQNEKIKYFSTPPIEIKKEIINNEYEEESPLPKKQRKIQQNNFIILRQSNRVLQQNEKNKILNEK